MRESFDDFRVRAADDPASLLIVILDTCVDSWTTATGKLPSEAVPQAVSAVQSVTEQLLVFLNTFLLLHESNRVVVILSSTAGSEVVYPLFSVEDDLPETNISAHEDDLLNGGTAQIEKQALSTDPGEALPDLRERFVSGVKRSVSLQEQQDDPNRQSTITNSLATALCIFNRARRIKATSMAANTSNGRSGPDSADVSEQFNGRILYISSSEDDSQHYVPIMNCIFSAQRMGVPIDTCVLGTQDSTYFQQAAHLTRGVYVKPTGWSTNSPSALIQILHSVFLIDKESRDFLSMPAPEKVDFRASCLLTKKIIDNGYTCSVCLSTFDVSISKQVRAICPICNARYTPASQRRQPRRT